MAVSEIYFIKIAFSHKNCADLIQGQKLIIDFLKINAILSITMYALTFPPGKINSPTVYNVAEKAGVSIATVSRVINNSPNVRPKTREKVLKVIEELDYHPNLSAQGPALNITEIIALIFPDISGSFYSEVLRGVEKEVHQHDYKLLIYGTH